MDQTSIGCLDNTVNVRFESKNGGINQKEQPDRVTGAVATRNMPSNYDYDLL